MTRDELFAGILVSTANGKSVRERTDVSGLAGTDSYREAWEGTA